MAYISQITLPNNSTYNLKDSRVDNLGTAAEKNFTTTISSEGTDLPTAGAVYTAIQNSTPVTLCTYSSSPQGDGTETQFQITHGLNTTNVFVSVNITDTNGTYIAPLTSVQASAEIGYRVKIINANKIEVTFTAAPGTGAAVINVFAGISNYINADNVSY